MGRIDKYALVGIFGHPLPLHFLSNISNKIYFNLLKLYYVKILITLTIFNVFYGMSKLHRQGITERRI